MKLNKLFLGAIAVLASAAMVACSDDAPDNPGVDVPKDGGYIAVNIVAPSGAASRGSSAADDLVAGKGFENEVVSVTFFLFNGDKLFGVQGAETIEIKTDNSGQEGINKEKIISALLVIKEKEVGDPIPDKFVTVLNLTDEQVKAFQDDNNLTLSSLRQHISSEIYGIASKINASEKTFIMSNSVYASGNDEMCATDIVAPLHTTPKDATDNPVDVYVERIAAKVKVTNTADNINNLAGTQTQKISHWDETNKQLVEEDVVLMLDVQGIAIANSTNQSYLFKNIGGSDGITTLNSQWKDVDNTPKWTDVTNHRSYWAVSAGNAYSTPSWNNISALDPDGYYIHENTTAEADNQTAILAKVQLKANGNGKSMVQWSGKIYEPSTFPVMMAQNLNNLGYKLKGPSDAAAREFLPADLEMLTEKNEGNASIREGFDQWQTCCQLKSTENTTTYFLNDTETKAETVNTFLKAPANRGNYWKDGMSYYYVPIEHFGPTDKTETTAATYDYTIGVVRNHIYQLTINKFTGLGTPVWDPSEPIDPGKPDDNKTLYYLAAQINILSWKVVSQDVNFGE